MPVVIPTIDVRGGRGRRGGEEKEGEAEEEEEEQLLSNAFSYSYH